MDCTGKEHLQFYEQYDLYHLYDLETLQGVKWKGKQIVLKVNNPTFPAFFSTLKVS